MSKYRSKKIFLCLLIGLLGISPYTFAIDFSKVLQQSSQSNQDITTLFAGKSQVSNIYEKALKLAKTNELGATQKAIDGVVAYFSKQSCAVTSKDVLYVLYNSNIAFQTFFTHVVISDMQDGGWTLPLPADITKSYAHFFSCFKIQHPTVDNYSDLASQVADVYYQSINGNFMLDTMSQSNYGEDLYRNGNKSDSDFDLLLDINDIGNIFFSSFKSTPEMLFYALPTASGQGGSDNASNTSTGVTTGTTPDPKTENGTGNENGTKKTVADWTLPSLSIGGTVIQNVRTPASLGTTDTERNQTITTDPDVQQFLATTNPSSFAQSEYEFVVGSQCATGAIPVTSEAAIQEEPIPTEEYVAGLIDFIKTANINDLINDHLLSGAKSAYDKAIKSNPNSPTDAINAIANTYSEMAFGAGSPGDSTCGDACINLPLAEQMQCQLGCARSCIQTCADTEKINKVSCQTESENKVATCNQLSGIAKTTCLISAKAKKVACDRQVDEDGTLCVVDCSCFMVSGPQGEGRNMVEDMVNLKFCKVPVESKTTTPTRQNISSIQQIIDAVVDALQGLKRSGNMVKYTTTKEFLDFDIKLTLSDILDFKIFFAFKPIFTQKADVANQRKKVIEAANNTDALLNLSPDAKSDNYNKYVIISDVAANKANLEDVGVKAAQQASLEKYTAAMDAANKSLKDPISLYQDQKIALLGEDVISFLDSHQVFRNTFVTNLLGMLEDASTLKSNIQNSK